LSGNLEPGDRCSVRKKTADEHFTGEKFRGRKKRDDIKKSLARLDWPKEEETAMAQAETSQYGSAKTPNK